MRDLFGNEGPEPGARSVAAPVQVDLFTAVAESLALRSGRPVSQERTRLTHPGAERVAGAGWRCLCGEPLRRRTRNGPLSCRSCDE